MGNGSGAGGGDERVTGQSVRLQDLSVEEETVVKTLLAALRRIRHGSVQLVVQDGRVVKIDTVEKTRFTSETQRPSA